MRVAIRLSFCFIIMAVAGCCTAVYAISSGRDSVVDRASPRAGPPGYASAVPSDSGLAALPESLTARPWPEGTQVLRFEDLEGAILVRAKLVSASGRDTSGIFVLDTGAGFLALDLGLARLLGVADSVPAAAAVALAPRPLARLELGGLQMDQVWPLITVDAGVIRRVTGRPVLGLLGQALFRDRAVVLDYLEGILVILPPGAPLASAPPASGSLALAPLASGSSAPPASAPQSPAPPASGSSAPSSPGPPAPASSASGFPASASPAPAPPAPGPTAQAPPAPAQAPTTSESPTSSSPVPGLGLSATAVAIPFRLAGDGKMLVSAWVTGRVGQPAGKVTLIVDTGATKSVFFRAALDRRLPGWKAWPALRGLGAPTLTGAEGAELVRVAGVELRASGGSVTRSGMDAAVLAGGLGEVLADDVGEPVDGLLGYSFLKHYRIALDFPRGVLWLDSSRGDVSDRLEEYSHPGLQLESVREAVRVFAVAEGSPAARAGIRAGDELVAINGESVSDLDVVTVARKLEGAPGTRLSLRLRRGQREWVCRLVRRRLL